MIVLRASTMRPNPGVAEPQEPSVSLGATTAPRIQVTEIHAKVAEVDGTVQGEGLTSGVIF